MTWTFIINRRAPSLNEHVQNAGPNRWRYAKDRDMWCLEFRVCRNNGCIPKATSKRRLVVTRLYCGREQERDYINLVGGMKILIDAMVLEGLLVDDKPSLLDDEYRQVRTADKTSGLRFELSDIAVEVAA